MATLTVVAQYGYENASLARIASQAGLSKGLISHHFRDKDDLMEQAVRVTAASLRDQIAAQIDLTAPVPEVIRAAIRRVARITTTHRVERKAVGDIVNNLRQPDGSPRLDLSTYEDTYRAQERLFRRGQAEGTLRSFDTRVMAATYQGAIDAMLAYFDAYPDTDVAHYADALGDLIVAAVTQPTPDQR